MIVDTADLRARYERLQRKLSALISADENEETPPCVGCLYLERCAARHLACKAFLHYVDVWRTRSSKPSTRIPAKRYYEKVFPHE